MDLQALLESVLLEQASKEEIIDAIKKHYEVELYYTADVNKNEIKGKGKRIIQPVAIGYSKAGNMVLRAFQPFGDTKTKTPHWKTFRVDKIVKWKPKRKNIFQEPPSQQFKSMAKGEYNPHGDGSMTQVLFQADFTNSKKYHAGEGRFANLKKANDARAKAKQERQPNSKLKTTIQKSYDLSDVDYIKRNLELWQNSDAAKFFRNNKNQESARDMSRITKIGDDTQSTIGPITKNNLPDDTSDNIVNNNNVNKTTYNKISNNGPIFKNDIKQNNSDIDNEENLENNVENEQ